MTSFDVRVLTDDTRQPQRLYQLSPEPAPGWWRFLAPDIRSESLEANGLDPSIQIEQVGSDLRVSPITPESADATDQFVAAAVRAATEQAHLRHSTDLAR